MRAWLVRLMGALRRDRDDEDFAAELEAHLQLHIDDNIRSGMSPREALNPPRATYPTPDRLRTLHNGLMVNLGEIQGMEAVGLTNTLPGRAPGLLLAQSIGLHGGPVLPPEPRVVAIRLTASPGYFEAAGVPLLAGRAFRDTDGQGGRP